MRMRRLLQIKRSGNRTATRYVLQPLDFPDAIETDFLDRVVRSRRRPESIPHVT